MDLSSIVITRQARHDLLEKYRPRILMTEAELAEDAVIINVDDIIIAHHVKSTVWELSYDYMILLLLMLN